MSVFQNELTRFQLAEAASGSSLNDSEQRVINLLIEDELIRQKAASQGIIADPNAVDAEIASITAEMGADYFNGWLSDNAYTMEDFRSLITLNMLTEQMTAPIIASIPMVDTHVHARHILVNSADTAQVVLDRLAAGEDFSSLAAEYSLDVTTRTTGGDLGWFSRGTLLVPEVEEIAFSLADNQISGVIQSDWGFHIVQTLEKADNQEIRPEVRQRLIAEALETWRQSLREGADIQVLIATP